MSKTVEIHMPDVDVYCPKCDDEICVNGSCFEVNSPKHFGVANAYCDNCDYYFTIGLVN